MKFHEPKTKSGKPLLGVTVTYHLYSPNASRWFINGERVYFEKVASLLEYPHKSSLHKAIKDYGINLIMTKGLDKCKATQPP